MFAPATVGAFIADAGAVPESPCLFRDPIQEGCLSRKPKPASVQPPASPASPARRIIEHPTQTVKMWWGSKLDPAVEEVERWSYEFGGNVFEDPRKIWPGTATELAVSVLDDWYAGKLPDAKTQSAALAQACKRFLQKDGTLFTVKSLLALLGKRHKKMAGNPSK
jgi:hypothetical protein